VLIHHASLDHFSRGRHLAIPQDLLAFLFCNRWGDILGESEYSSCPASRAKLVGDFLLTQAQSFPEVKEVPQFDLNMREWGEY